MADFGGRKGGFNFSDNNFDDRYNRNNDNRDDYDNLGRRSSGRGLESLPPLSDGGGQLPPISRSGDQYAPRGNEYSPRGQVTQQARPVANMPSQSVKGSSVVIYSPQTYNDVQTLIDYLKRQEPVIIDFSKISGDSAQRILDFMSGAIYALSGSMQRIAQSIFLLTPTGVSITIPLEQLPNNEGKK